MSAAHPAASPVLPLGRRLALKAIGALEEGYVRLAGRPAFQKINLRLLNAALRARGYNNVASLHESGEACFVDRLAGLQPALCVDVGANVGQYASQLLARTGAVVHAFEPMPASRAALSAIAATYPGRLHVHPYALGDANGTAQITFGPDDSQLATLSTAARHVDYVGASNVRSAPVEVRRLDDLVASGELPLAGREVDLLKIDTEGYEYDVLAGARRFLAECRPKFVQVEFNWHQLFCGHSLWQLAALLPGYAPHQLLPHGAGWHRVDPKAPASNVYCFANFVFVRDGATAER